MLVDECKKVELLLLIDFVVFDTCLFGAFHHLDQDGVT